VGELEDLAAVIVVDGQPGLLQLHRSIEWEADAPVTLLTGPAGSAIVDNMEVDPRFADPRSFP